MTLGEGADRRDPTASLLGLVVLTIVMLTGLAACSSGADEGTLRSGEDPGSGTAHRETTTASETHTGPTGGGEPRAEAG